MAKTKTSAYGKQKQKIVPVRKYKRNGKTVKGHRRSTPNQSIKNPIRQILINNQIELLNSKN